MTNEFLKVTDGVFTLTETEKENQFKIYRNDGKKIRNSDENVAHMLYQKYLINQIAEGKIKEVPMSIMNCQMSADRKNIILKIRNIKR